jgi:hypothetical protein
VAIAKKKLEGRVKPMAWAKRVVRLGTTASTTRAASEKKTQRLL